MMKNDKRKQIEKGILEFAKAITPGGGNHTIYTGLFKTINDKQFTQFWESIKNRGYIPIFLDNFDQKEMVNYDDIVKLSTRWNIPLEQHVIIPDSDTGVTYTTPEKAIVGIVDMAKQRQIIIKKIGVSKDDYNVDDLTGQPIGDSKAGGISKPELDILVALGLTTMAKELSSVKGGDLDAYREYKTQLYTTGRSNTNAALRNGSGVKSLQTAEWLLKGRHIISDIGRR